MGTSTGLLISLLLIIDVHYTVGKRDDIPVVDWNKMATDTLNKALKQEKNENRAKNVILFLGDGMGISSVTASRIYKGQKEGKPGEETVFNFEDFPYLALSKTYSVDRQIPDSAATGTAILCGVKTNFVTLGVNENVKDKDCDASLVPQNQVDSILKWSFAAGKSTGVVTTARLTHASPGAAYANSANRYWESDKDLIPAHNGRCKDIAAQLIEDHGYINVAFGGGRRNFWPSNLADPEYPHKNGTRLDNRDLMELWRTKRELDGVSYASFWNKEGFDQADPMTTDYMLGLFDYSHMEYELDRVKKSPPEEPSLAEMTEKAINVLKRNDNGFFLMVEGAKIDIAHHDALAKKAFEDTIAFESAIAKALEMTDLEDTLIVVTADHSLPFTLGGYTARGQPLLGFVGPESDAAETSLDGFPTPILGYTTGPVSGRNDLTGEDTEADDFMFPALIPMEYAAHGGEDVAIYAHGPWAHLIHGTQEQNYIAHVMGFAACVGDHIQKGDHCTAGGAQGARAQGALCLGVVILILEYVS